MSNDCLHCSEAIPGPRATLAAPASGYCCAGCEAAAAFSREPNASFSDYDNAAVLKSIALSSDKGLMEADVLVDGIRCGACAVDIERRLRKLSGIAKLSVNAHNRIVTVRWNQNQQAISHILQTIADGGYTPHPLPLDADLSDLRREDRRAILKLGLAGLGTMQVMMLSAGLYFGSQLDVTAELQRLLSWAAMLLATPVVLYAGLPFFAGALNDLRHKRLGMDVPVALAVGAAYSMSVFHTLNGSGEIWFDSACMFVFFLSLGRHWEARGRRRAQQGLRTLVASQPQTVTIIVDGQTQAIPAKQLQVGMRLLVRPGETFPVDGHILKGTTTVDESLLTGESRPLERCCGDKVLAGSLNRDQALEINAEKIGADTTRAHLMRLLRRAEAKKPAVALLADRIAARFVLAVLVIATLTAALWSQIDPSRVFEITLAVLVVTCPCALSLATPASLSAAAAALARRGLLVTRGHTLEALTQITHVVFDKTGTLTDQALEIVAVRETADWPRHRILELAAAIEREQNHPIAGALRKAAEEQTLQLDTQWQAGLGVMAEYNSHRYALGSPSRLLGTTSQKNHQIPDDGNTWIVLTEDGKSVGWIALRARLRPEAKQALQALEADGLHVQLMSGDHAAAVKQVANALLIPEATGGMLPQDKLDAVEALRQQGAKVMMVGDGLNDAPVLAGADVSVAMQSGAALAQASADAVLLSGDLNTLAAARELAFKARRILRQNLSWAVSYNTLAVPLAVTGLITPWLAAIGMSLSSLLVVGNALRLLRQPLDASSQQDLASQPPSFRGSSQSERLEESLDRPATAEPMSTTS